MTEAKHPTSPCSTCPYRKDVPLAWWSGEEFLAVLDAERSQFGTTFACHKHVGLPPKQRGFCAGWLHDQKERNLPSIALRLALLQDENSVKALDNVTDGGHELYSAREMCEENLEAIESGVNPHRRTS